MKICVVGAGTAGWLAALIISKNHPQHDVVVVASSKIGIIGAGEGVSGRLTDVISGYFGDLGIDPIDFIKKTGALPKYGIMHRNWTSTPDYDYFGPIDGTPTSMHIPDGILTYLKATNNRPIHEGTFFGQMFSRNISPIDKNTNTFSNKSHAYHFDARLVADYLQNIADKTNNCSYIDATINDVILNNEGHVKQLILDDNRTVEADFFIDCSGFKKLLINKLGAKWISYQDVLPVNKAIPFFLQYNDNVKPQCFTDARAMSSGWMWQASVQHRRGCGYTYCDEYISDDEALNEIEKTLGHKIEPLRDPFTFDTGRLDKVWIKNVMALGLSTSFAEPLEATSIHGAIVQIVHFAFEFLQDTKEETVNQGSIDLFNKRIITMFDDFKNFLVAHYLGDRTDTEFWKDVTNRKYYSDFAFQIKDSAKTRIPTHQDIPGYEGAAGWQIWSYILTGTDQISQELSQKYLQKYPEIIPDSNQRLFDLDQEMLQLQNTCYSFDEFIDVIQNKDVSW